ncbi:MAG: lipoprotein [Rhizobiaceae bacterium]|nr:lipoprotein [Rhizobiaceae bacterium]
MNRSLTVSLAALALVSLTLAGCGRKGDLDVPGTPVVDQNNASKKAAPVEDRPFVLDPLL